jgi:hypothetical protein
MAAAITHNIDDVIQRLNTFQRVDLPRATRRTMSQFGYDFAKRYVPGYMKAVFDRPNKLTLRSLSYKVVSPYEVQFDFRQNLAKGNDPARYLYPVTKGLPGNEAYQTKFTRYVHSAGIVPRNRYPIPFKDNLSKNQYGKVSQGEYSKVWSGLETTKGAGKTGRGFRYFSIPDNRNRSRVSTRQGSLFDLPDGIYRVKGRGAGGIQLLFTYARKQPTVPKIFDYYGFAEKTVKFRLGAMLSRNLR